MRIVEIREKTASIASPIANAYIDFSKMTCSVVAVITDVIRDGKPVVGVVIRFGGVGAAKNCHKARHTRYSFPHLRW